ncbi:hypothetical protein PQX77_002219 [Marasmius sp. AFHP31]|nr:hypothetical protein PQX77_002219 [Marasmius sp. AFHP31]
MGAFTENKETTDALFHAGIPVWLIRPISRTPAVHIDAVGNFIEEKPDQKLHVRFGGEVDTTNVSPSHRVIYNHLPGKLERYIAMANYLHSLFQYHSFFGSSKARSSTSVVRTLQTSCPTRPFSAVVNSTPGYASKPKTHAQHQNTNKINPFINSSPLLPSVVPAWSDALHSLAHHDLTIPPPPGHNRGYWLPPPRLFVSPADNKTKALLICNWLKVRRVTIYRVSIEAPCLSYKQWRSYMNISGSNDSQVSQTSTGKRHESMQALLNDFLRSHHLSLRYNELRGVSASWKDNEITDTVLPPRRVVQEILWELFELGFRQELLALDSQLDQSSMETWERQNILDSCWTGRGDVVDGHEGLGSATLAVRIPCLRALHRVMSTWKGTKPPEVLEPFPCDEGSHNFLAKCGKIERAVAMFYMLLFLSVFGREASVPHTLS